MIKRDWYSDLERGEEMERKFKEEGIHISHSYTFKDSKVDEEVMKTVLGVPPPTIEEIIVDKLTANQIRISFLHITNMYLHVELSTRNYKHKQIMDMHVKEYTSLCLNKFIDDFMASLTECGIIPKDEI